MAAVLLILYYVNFESGFDTFHENADMIYRIEVDTYREGRLDSRSALSPPAVGKSLKDNFPTVQQFTRIAANPGKTIIQLKENHKSIRAEKAYLADASIFNLMTIRVIRGRPAGLLSDPRDVVISQSLANKLWGSRWEKIHLPAAVELFSQGLAGDFQVKAVYEDFPANAHFKPKLLASQLYIKELIGNGANDDNWDFKFFYTYVMIRKDAEIAQLRNDFNRYVADIRKEALAASGTQIQFQFQPLKDIHLKSNIQFELESNGDERMIYGLTLIGIVIMAIAWINFVNLATARGITRAREVGIRKVHGALGRQLIAQFTTEALVINFISLMVALVMVQLIKHEFSGLSGVPVSFMGITGLIGEMRFNVIAASILLLGVLSSTVYPAVMLSHYHPIRALKKNLPRPGSLSLRQSLVVLQLTFSFLAIAATVVVYRQIIFMRSADLGVTLAHTVIIEAPEDTQDPGVATSVFRRDVLQLPFANGFSASSAVPGQEVTLRSYNLKSEKTGARTNCGMIGVDEDFIDNYGLSIVAGASFSPLKNDYVILNEEAVGQLGFVDAADAIGTILIHEDRRGVQEFTIGGVVKNYHQRSLRSAFEPILFRYGQGRAYYSVLLHPATNSQVQDQLRSLGATFEKDFPGNPFNYFFLDAEYDSQYRAELKFSTIFLFSALLAVVIASLGLLALSTFILTLRTSEIGIRKVFGASLQSLVLLLCRDYARLLLTAMLIGVPVIWIVASRWLERYAFSIQIDLLILFIPVAGLLVIFLTTVGLQTLRAASRSPIDAIREE
jgi:putative ABC transport system permease protein